MHKIWMTEYQWLIDKLNEDIMTGTNLSIPEPYQRFYTKTDWFKDVIGAVLLQTEDSVEAIEK